jgi:CheY-like chemotaxis protein
MTTNGSEDGTPPRDGEFIDRRSGKDRRAEDDRRRAGRRHRRARVEDDRRAGTDRRQESRRSGTDRRIFTDPRYKKPRPKVEAPSVYSTRDAATVQRMLSRVGHMPRCPVCDGSFTLGPIDHRGADTVRQVSCVACGRGTVVTNCVLARVMVLTPVEAMRRMLGAALTGVGHEVIQPPRTGIALELYRENQPDLVMIDTFALAEVDGQRFIRQLRMEFTDPRILVVAPRTSRGAVTDPWATATGLGATRVLRSPFTRDDLLRAVRDTRRS